MVLGQNPLDNPPGQHRPLYSMYNIPFSQILNIFWLSQCIILYGFWNNGGSKCSLLVFDFLFFMQTMSDRNLHSSFVFFYTRKANTGFIWQWMPTILTKFDGGYFSRFYQSLIKGCTNQSVGFVFLTCLNWGCADLPLYPYSLTYYC